MELEGGQIGASLLARRGGASGTFVGQGATAAVTVGITQRVLDAVHKACPEGLDRLSWCEGDV